MLNLLESELEKIPQTVSPFEFNWKGKSMYQLDNGWTSIAQSKASTQWTRLQDKLFERALVVFPEEVPDRWVMIAEQVPGKSQEEVREHYEDLVHDVFEIDSGRVEMPSYGDESVAASAGLSGWDSENHISFGLKPKQSENERKKGTPWTAEEHKLFLVGLSRYGKGDWRSISRNVVVTRTPTQVASHAQKYFLRQVSGKKERKRSSIHDITTVDNNSVPLPIDQNWIPPPAGPKQEPQALQQQFNLPSHFPDQASGLGFQNFGFQM
ncbi:Transcription factor DIVARICATA [Quillaja saponaria]|uniref:Transcription factor DIVARICATA n=1 Tax=Quillaja saponaria TaxID=32244 RepID=A0AAD7M5W2_QUISA|nr:Transcription factor DIVARICATA [Quillaja saponaria]